MRVQTSIHRHANGGWFWLALSEGLGPNFRKGIASRAYNSEAAAEAGLADSVKLWRPEIEVIRLDLLSN